MESSRLTVAEVVAVLREADRATYEHLKRELASDARSGVAAALVSAERRFAREAEQSAHTDSLYALQRELDPHDLGLVIGVDEVGRGSLAGPLTVAAVVLPSSEPIGGLDDSKRLSPTRREELAEKIHATARAVSIVHIPADQIDLMGMSACIKVAVVRSVLGCDVDPVAVLIDGNPLRVHPAERAIVKGDSKHAAIAAASIVAKVERDALMRSLDDTYPGYAFAASKGYASPEHIERIRSHGLTPLHRATFCTSFTSDALF